MHCLITLLYSTTTVKAFIILYKLIIDITGLTTQKSSIQILRSWKCNTLLLYYFRNICSKISTINFIYVFIFTAICHQLRVGPWGKNYIWLCAKEKTLQGDKSLLTAEALRAALALLYLFAYLVFTKITSLIDTIVW